MSQTKTTFQFSWPFVNATKSTIKTSMAKIRFQHTKASGGKNEIVQINKWHGKYTNLTVRVPISTASGDVAVCRTSAVLPITL